MRFNFTLEQVSNWNKLFEWMKSHNRDYSYDHSTFVPNIDMWDIDDDGACICSFILMSNLFVESFGVDYVNIDNIKHLTNKFKKLFGMDVIGLMFDEYSDFSQFYGRHTDGSCSLYDAVDVIRKYLELNSMADQIEENQFTIVAKFTTNISLTFSTIDSLKEFLKLNTFLKVKSITKVEKIAEVTYTTKKTSISLSALN